MYIIILLHVLSLVVGCDTATFPVNNGSPPSSAAYSLYHNDRVEIHTDERVFIG